jgi:hypothetical protein|tara:strand:+ start:587 stop:802 length:216 start_codon:yes stop_codon:yes gene_type:complete
MSTLDLHGIKHADVKDKLSHYLFWEKPGRSHYTIITGNSKKMQEIVFEYLDKHEFKYYIPSHNLGEIRIVE